MFLIKLFVENPFRNERFKNLFSKCYKVSKNKFFEFEVLYHSVMVIDFSLGHTSRRDHGGLEFNFGALGYSLAFRLLDYRHWDYKKNKWVMAK